MTEQNTNKKTEITKKVVKKPIPTIVFNDDSLLALLMPINSTTFVEIVTVTDPNNFGKTANPYYDKDGKKWKVEKVAVLNGGFATNYENGVKKATNDDDFEAQDHVWAAHYNGSKVVMINKKEIEAEKPTKYYAAIRILRPDLVKYRWVDTKEELTAKELEELKSFKFPSKSQPIVWRTVTLSNIREIRMNGIRYQRG